jgi:hypothetical protein
VKFIALERHDEHEGPEKQIYGEVSNASRVHGEAARGYTRERAANGLEELKARYKSALRKR